MKIKFGGGDISGKVSPPPSKSHTHRAFFISAMADGRSTVQNSLISEDTVSTLKACEAIGVSCIEEAGQMFIDGGRIHAPSEPIYAGNSGTTMRIITGICSLFEEESVITGDGSLSRRPMKPLLDSLERLGVKCGSAGGFPPISVAGPNKGGQTTTEGNFSSQFTTSLMMCAPLAENDTEITVVGRQVSAPYVDMTADMMRHFGAFVEKEGKTVRVKGGTGYKPKDVVIPADLSSAAYPLIAGALGGNVSVSGLKVSDSGVLLGILENAGAEVSVRENTITVSRGGHILPLDVDMSDVPDLFPAVAVLLSTAEGTSRLYGAEHLKYKESNRIESTVRMINSLGGDAVETEDGCVIRGKKKLRGGTVDTYGDHRILMSAAAASVVCSEPVVSEDTNSYSVSYPSFLSDMERIGLRVSKF
ncbi:MAG: 3-phosphoshikimate 1-carboxyvinyltransferase [Candidatus Methanomethylophilaceae archaeon]|jgi:3-phosphoshikimate 1-carboxyvinyltransferase